MLGIGLWLNGGGAGFARGGPRIVLSASTVAEDASVTDVVGTASAPGTTGTPTWSLTDNAAGQFAINSSTGVVTVAAAIAGNSDTITISVSGLTPPPPDKVFTIKTILAAPVLDLHADSDTGSSSTDDISTDTTPTFTTTTSALTSEGHTLRYYNNAALIATHVLTAGEAAGGVVNLELPAMSAGTHPITVTADNGNGASPVSNEISYVLDLTAPTISALSPTDNAVDIATDAALTVTYSKNVYLTSIVTVTILEGGIPVASYDNTDIGVAISVTGAVLTILNPGLTEEAAVEIEVSGVASIAGVAAPDIDTGAWTFTVVSTAFVPTDIANCAVWLDASDAATITESAGLVSAWTNKANGSNNAGQATGSRQPTTGTRTLNSLNVLDFVGDDYFDLASGISRTSGYAVFFVGEVDTITTIIQNIVAGASGVLSFRINPTSGALQILRNAQASILLASQAVVAGTPFIAVATTKTSTNKIYEDGGTPSTNATDPAYSADFAMIGARATPADFFNGKFAELIVYTNADLSAADINAVGGYLGTKWGITWNAVS